MSDRMSILQKATLVGHLILHFTKIFVGFHTFEKLVGKEYTIDKY